MFGFLFFITHYLSLNFCHSSLITHHLKLNTYLAPSFIFHHSTFFTLFVSPMPVTESDPSCFVPAENFHPHFFSFLFSHFPFLFQPYHSPKAQTQTYKNFSSSPTWVQQRDLLHQSPTTATKCEETQTQQFSFTIIIKTQTQQDPCKYINKFMSFLFSSKTQQFSFTAFSSLQLSAW